MTRLGKTDSDKRLDNILKISQDIMIFVFELIFSQIFKYLYTKILNDKMGPCVILVEGTLDGEKWYSSRN